MENAFAVIHTRKFDDSKKENKEIKGTNGYELR